MQEGKTYGFEPPIKATGILGEGDATQQFRNMHFPTGRCVKVGTHTVEFRGTVDGHVYKFFSIPEQGGSKATPLD